MSVYVMYEWKKERKCYEDLKSARKGIYEWTRKHKDTEVYVFKSIDSPIPFGSALWYNFNKYPLWFDVSNFSIDIPDSGSSEDRGYILADGSLSFY